VAKQEQPQQPSNNILIDESTNILARYRIPIDNNEVDYKLQLPSDDDSSDFSDETKDHKNGNEEPKENPKANKEEK